MGRYIQMISDSSGIISACDFFHVPCCYYGEDSYVEVGAVAIERGADHGHDAKYTYYSANQPRIVIRGAS